MPKTAPKKRGPGRPRGSRNKPKHGVAQAQPAHAPARASSPAADVSGLGSIEYHEAQRNKLQALFDALPPNALPKDFAALDAGIARHSRIIAELRGETRVTELKILKSEAWAALWLRIENALDPHPDALDAVLAAIADGSPEEHSRVRDPQAAGEAS